MSTLIAVYDSEGCVGRCDAKCYDAEHPGCDCICGGSNHGVGRARAIDNTREQVRDWLDENAQRRGLDRDAVDELVGAEVLQEALFT